MAKLRLTLLGGFEARTDSGLSVAIPRKKARMLLAYLAMHPKQTHLRDKLATLLWDDAPTDQARLSLRQALFAIRQALPFDPTVLDGDCVAFAADAVTVYVTEFEQLVRNDDPEALERSAALYQGDLLEGIGPSSAQFEEWLRAERERLHELALEVLAKLLAHRMKLGVIEPAIHTALRLASLDPLQEVTHRALMRLYVRQGRRAAALRSIRSASTSSSVSLASSLRKRRSRFTVSFFLSRHPEWLLIRRLMLSDCLNDIGGALAFIIVRDGTSLR